ncbi:regulator of microtubule dynamics protein 1 [Cephus cinctus]|uniref:Regulator of microtubule dynamics protein 1 n=1 Tax=Cephus cinctus TaxID=211228 RepID=A0AAJ7FFI7_CEPCN|nr:regulator of microtubule dynamics protein 1 [Cephus cinctus]XP_015589294.1 regulator of microtubule dynamics protein 1 [Cephus cinctus]XP_015589295.1 regulator of microtubule dynamics protein 1 [Cephus cinctus]
MIFQRFVHFISNRRIAQKAIAYSVNKSSRQFCTIENWPKRLFLISQFSAMSIWGLIKKDPNENTIITAKEVLLAKADALFDQGEYNKIYELLNNYRDNRDVEILWRLSRALYKMSKTASEVEAKKMIYESYDLISTALSIQEDHYAVHKWMSVLLDSKSNYEGMKARIGQLYNVKSHMLRALELNPTDATTLHMLGCWCYHIADLAWYQRKIAAVIFGEPPSCTYEEALEYFEKAEKEDPMFYIDNLLFLGKTYLKLNRKEEALKYLIMASEYPVKNDYDHNAKQEALKLLAKM